MRSLPLKHSLSTSNQSSNPYVSSFNIHKRDTTHYDTSPFTKGSEANNKIPELDDEMEDILSPSCGAYLSATTSVSKSISKCDIANLENKIKLLEKQIDSIKDKHHAFSQKNELDKKTQKTSNLTTTDVVFDQVQRQLQFSENDTYKPISNHNINTNRVSILSAPGIKSRNSCLFPNTNSQVLAASSNTFEKQNPFQQEKPYQTFNFENQSNNIQSRISKPEETLAQNNPLDQLESVIVSMFDFMNLNIDQQIEEKSTLLSLKSYQKLSMNLLKSIKLQKLGNIETTMNNAQPEVIQPKAVQFNDQNPYEDFDEHSKRKSALSVLGNQSKKKKRNSKLLNKSAGDPYKRAHMF